MSKLDKKLKKAMRRFMKAEDGLRDVMELRGYRTVHGGGEPLPPAPYGEAFALFGQLSSVLGTIYFAETERRVFLPEGAAKFEIRPKEASS